MLPFYRYCSTVTLSPIFFGNHEDSSSGSFFTAALYHKLPKSCIHDNPKGRILGTSCLLHLMVRERNLNFTSLIWLYGPLEVSFFVNMFLGKSGYEYVTFKRHIQDPIEHLRWSLFRK